MLLVSCISTIVLSREALMSIFVLPWTTLIWLFLVLEITWFQCNSSSSTWRTKLSKLVSTRKQSRSRLSSMEMSLNPSNTIFSSSKSRRRATIPAKIWASKREWFSPPATRWRKTLTAALRSWLISLISSVRNPFSRDTKRTQWLFGRSCWFSMKLVPIKSKLWILKFLQNNEKPSI